MFLRKCPVSLEDLCGGRNSVQLYVDGPVVIPNDDDDDDDETSVETDALHSKSS